MSDRNRQADSSIRVCAIALLLALVGCSQEAPPEAPVVARPILMLTIGDSGGNETLEIPGSVAAAQSADLAFEVSGRMLDRMVEEGQLVAAGEVVAKLDPHDYAAERDRALARRDTSRADFDRYAKAFESNAVTEQQVSRAKGQLDIAEANLRVAAKALGDTQLRAPFAGRIARRLVDDFANVQAKEPVLVLQNESSLELRVNVAERDWARGDSSLDNDEVSRRINPRIVIGSRPDVEIPAVVRERSNIADPVTRTYQVTFGFNSPPGINISPGMTGKVIVDRYIANTATGDDGAISVPSNAVAGDDDNNAFVWVVDPGSSTVSRRAVSLGEVIGGEIRISGGLTAGERIAVSGVNSLSEGMLVREMDN